MKSFPHISARRIALVAILLSFFFCQGFGEGLFPVKRYVIASNGMFPNYPKDSSLWIRKKPYMRMKGIERGDVVIYRKELRGGNYDFIWRVIGLPGDEVIIEGEDIFINGNKVARLKKEETADQIIYTEKNGEAEYLVAYDKNPDPEKRGRFQMTVPEENFFVLGDNRDHARDSRYEGMVPYEIVIGKVM